MTVALRRKKRRSTAGRTPLAKFVLNYIRREFDRNDEGERVAYFELLSDFENSDIRTMLSTFKRRARWSDNYGIFLHQLSAAEED